MRILELRQHLLIEAAVLDGARNILAVLQRVRQPDKKALQDVCCVACPTPRALSFLLFRFPFPLLPPPPPPPPIPLFMFIVRVRMYRTLDLEDLIPIHYSASGALVLSLYICE